MACTFYRFPSETIKRSQSMFLILSALSIAGVVASSGGYQYDVQSSRSMGAFLDGLLHVGGL